MWIEARQNVFLFHFEKQPNQSTPEKFGNQILKVCKEALEIYIDDIVALVNLFVKFDWFWSSGSEVTGKIL